MSPANDYLPILQAVHRLDCSEGRWLASIAKAAAPALGFGAGAIACVLGLDGEGRCVLRAIRSHGVRSGLLAGLFQTTARQRHPERQPRPGSTPGGDGPRWRALFGPTPPATTLRRIAAATPGDRTLVTELRGREDALILRGTTASGDGGVAIVAPSPTAIRLSGRRQQALDRVATQLATADRLRTSLAGRDPFAATMGLRRHDVAAAAEVWTGLLAGRWSAVAHCDQDGRRLVLAVANGDADGSLLALATHERDVLAWASAGYSLKHAASELGLGASTASELLRSALRKLRLTSLSEAVRLFSAAAVPGLAVRPPAREPSAR